MTSVRSGGGRRHGGHGALDLYGRMRSGSLPSRFDASATSLLPPASTLASPAHAAAVVSAATTTPTLSTLPTAQARAQPSRQPQHHAQPNNNSNNNDALKSRDNSSTNANSSNTCIEDQAGMPKCNCVPNTQECLDILNTGGLAARSGLLQDIVTCCVSGRVKCTPLVHVCAQLDGSTVFSTELVRAVAEQAACKDMCACRQVGDAAMAVLLELVGDPGQCQQLLQLPPVMQAIEYRLQGSHAQAATTAAALLHRMALQSPATASAAMAPSCRGQPSAQARATRRNPSRRSAAMAAPRARTEEASFS